MISLIAALGRNREIGFENKLLWRLPDDFKRFKELTLGHPVIMGRKTFESIGKPLPDRKNIVITRAPQYQAEGCFLAHSFGEALALAENDSEIFVIGGAEIYTIALQEAGRMYLTYVDTEIDADTFFPDFLEEEWRVVSTEYHPADEKHAYGFTFKTLERK